MFTITSKSAWLGFALLLVAVSAAPQKTLQVIENSYESTTFSVDLPRSAPARFSLRPCETCPSETLSLDGSSQYFIGRERISYPEFRAFASKNSRGMMIHFDPKTKVVTRLVVSG